MNRVVSKILKHHSSLKHHLSEFHSFWKYAASTRHVVCPSYIFHSEFEPSPCAPREAEALLPDKVKAFTFTLLFGIAGGMMADFYFDVFHNGRRV